MSAYETWKTTYPLHAVVQIGDLPTLELDKEAYLPLINTIDNERWLPIHYCCFEGHHEVLEWLLVNGSKVDAGNHFGSTPLHLVLGTGNLECLKILLKYITTKDQFNIRNEDRQIPRQMLMIAECNQAQMRLLLDEKEKEFQ